MLGEEQANSVNGMDTQVAFKDQATTPLQAELKNKPKCMVPPPGMHMIGSPED